MATRERFEVGQKFMIPYPFTRTEEEKVCWPPGRGFHFYPGSAWRPGTRPAVLIKPDGEPLCHIADGMGWMLLEVVEVWVDQDNPAKQKQIIFNRQWIDPEGERWLIKKRMRYGVLRFSRTSKRYAFDYTLSAIVKYKEE